jgi:hypothetical protein
MGIIEKGQEIFIGLGSAAHSQSPHQPVTDCYVRACQQALIGLKAAYLQPFFLYYSQGGNSLLPAL